MKGILCFIFTAVDCQLGDWSDWSSCTETCGIGVKTRTRNVTVVAANDRNSCTDDLKETEQCLIKMCRKLKIKDDKIY